MKTYNPLNNKSNAVDYASINICPICARRLTKECGCTTDMVTEEWRAAYFAAEQIKVNEAINVDDVILARLPFDRDDDDILTAARKVAPDAELLGPQEPPDDYRIWNRRQPNGTFKPLSQFFDEAVKKADAELTTGDMTSREYGESQELGTRFTIVGGEVMELDSHLESQYDEQNGDIELPF